MKKEKITSIRPDIYELEPIVEDRGWIKISLLLIVTAILVAIVIASILF